MEISSYFRRYLQNIQPSKSSRERATQLHTTLTDRLAKDKSFSDWYDGTFLYGSYRRNTAIQPIKDVDICVLLKIDPNDNKYQPKDVINRLRKVLEDNGYETKTALQRRSVRIDMSQTTLDIVPVVATLGKDEPLKIPDRKLEEWVDTHPKGHLTTAIGLNKDTNKRYIPFVKIVKAWYRYQLKTLRDIERPKPKGFTLEALVAQYQDKDAPSYGEAFVNFLDNLWKSCGALLEEGTFPEVPDPGLTGKNLTLTFTTTEVKRFGTVVKDSLAKARLALENEDLEESAIAWNEIFGPQFPVEPETTTKAFATEAFEKREFITDDEVEEIDLPGLFKVSSLNLVVGLAHEKEGPIANNYSDNGWPLPKKKWLRFTASNIPVAKPFNIKWIVDNHGQEAKLADELHHEADGEDLVHWESTLYKGSHTMTCEIHRNGVVLARAKYRVNIK